MEPTLRDIEMFSRFGVPIEYIHQAGIERVTDREARDDYGMFGRGDLSGIVFPYINPMSGQRWTSRLRRDNPEIEDGKPKKKYISAYGDRRHFFFTPGSADLVRDVNVPVVLVEAEKSALALACWSARTGRKLLAVGMGGCWSWRGRIGKIENSNGQRVDEVGPIPDLACACIGRKVFVLLDANVNSNSKVQQARKMLVRQLENQGAQVWVADLPSVEGVNGPDDYIGVCGDDAMTSVLDAATVSRPKGKVGKETQTQLLLRLASQAELFHTPNQKAYATIAVNGHKEHWPIESNNLRQWLRRQYYSETTSAPQSQAILDAVNMLVSRALFEGREHAVSLRVAAAGNRIYLDLANDKWEVLEIGPSGWKLLPESEIKFCRADGMLPLPVPRGGGKVDDLRAFVNVGDQKDWCLIVAWLLQAFSPHGPYPICVLNGEHGSAKSTTAKVLRELIDPNSASHSSPPTSVRDVMIAASNQWILSLDNLSQIPDWLSDALCRMATGGGIRTRQLYTDTRETIIEVQRPIILNGIGQVATRPDLLDRAVVISLPRITEYRDEQEFWSSFYAKRPTLLGALLDAICLGLKHWPDVKLNRKPRMADFALWGTALEPGLGWKSGAFMTAYTYNRESSNDGIIEGSPVGIVIEKMMATVTEFEGTMSNLLKELERYVDERVISQRNWPKTPLALRNALKRLSPNLLSAGISLQFGDRDMTRARNRLVRVSKVSSALSAASEMTLSQELADPATEDNPLQVDNACTRPSNRKGLETAGLDSADVPDSPSQTQIDRPINLGAEVEVEV